MDLELSDDQLDLRDNMRAVLEGMCPPSVVRDIYEGSADATPTWKQMVDLYWPALGIPEDAGGLGMGFVEVGLLAEELGRAAAPGPLLATTTQFVPLLVESGLTEQLSQVSSGEISGSVAIAEGRRWGLGGVEASATRDGDTWRITGTKSAVLSGLEVDQLAVVARDRDSSAPGVFIVDAAATERVPMGHLDPALGLATVHLNDVAATHASPPGEVQVSRIERAMEQSVVATALHTVGACRRIFEITLDYAKVREQYDQVIGSFQALKHKFAEMYLAVERANAVCYFAAAAIAEDDERRTEAAHLAKAAAGDCQRLVAEDGLQLHGGIGYTWENDLHFLLKRAKAGELLQGSSAHHRAQLAELLGVAA